MARSNVRRLIEPVFQTGVLYVFLGFCTPSACHAELATLDEAMIALENWRASFNSIHITYDIDEGVIENSSPIAMITVGEYYWSEAKRFYWYQRFFKDGKQLDQHLDWSDGSICGQANSARGEGQEQAPLTMIGYGRIDATGNIGAQGRAVTPLFGLWQASNCRWLPEVLREQQATTRVISVDGAECLEVIYQQHGHSGPTTLVLDPRYSYLPRSMIAGWDYHVSQFNRFPPGIWMPTVGVLDLKERKQSWEITSVVFNQDIADEKVRIPDPGDRTRIMDINEGKAGTQGTPPPIPEVSDEDERSPMQGPGRPIVAKPHTGIWHSLPLWIAVAGISSLVISVAVRFARKGY